MIPKTIENLILVDFHDYNANLKNYDDAFNYTIKHLMPKAKKIHILYNGIEFTYFDENENADYRYTPASYLDLLKHFKEYGVHSLTKMPRVIVENAITPLTKNIFIYPKTFNYSKPWKLAGASDANVVNGLVKIIEDELDSLEYEEQSLYFPEWFFDIDDNIEEDEECVIVGGPKNNAVKEIAYLFKAVNIPYSLHKNGIFNG